jgi:NAD(P)-dependent dehydrogenase (short-subunit alcohol dehydrogenase family)
MNKVAMITGASRGLGKTLAAFLAGRGMDLIITARNADDLAATAQELKTYGVRAVALAGDVSEPAHRRRLVEAAQELGRLDLLVNNASLLGPSPGGPLGEPLGPALVDYSLETLEQVFAVNVLAPLGLIQAAAPLLRATQALVVNISSDAAVGGYAGWGGYGASKAALEMLSLTLANELRDEGVAVVSVDPGDMRTQMHQEAFPGEDISDRPLPEVTLPFWAWLLGQEPATVSGRRFQAQAEHWLVAA